MKILSLSTGSANRAILFMVTLLMAGFLRADPAVEIAGFSSLKIDLNKLVKGEIIATRSPGMSFPRGLSVESAFVVEAPLAKAIDAVKDWNGSNHPDLKIYLHSDLPANPAPGDFQKLSSAPNNSSVRSFVSATQKLSSNSGELQLSDAEVGQAPKNASGGGMPSGVCGFWSNILLKRTQAYVNGGLPAEPACNFSGQTIRVADELSALLKAQPKLRSQFHSILDVSGLAGKPAAKPSLYWELFDADGQGTLNLGASFASSSAKTAQAADLQYYASSSYFVYLTLYQLWPIEIGSKQATLIWRGDLLSASSLGNLHGIERNAAGSAMIKETQKLIVHFQKDIAGH